VLFQWPLVRVPSANRVHWNLSSTPPVLWYLKLNLLKKNIMNRPPRNPDETLFNKGTVGMGILQGIIVFFMVLAVYLITMGRGDDLARTVSFTTMIIANLSLILTNRSWSNTIFQTIKTPNKALWWVLTGALVFFGTGDLLCTITATFQILPLGSW